MSEVANPPSQGLHALILQQGVLVVDDSALQRKAAVSILRRIGVSKIYEAEDGNAALKMIRSLFLPPAIIILDLEMPGMDGIEFVQHLSGEGVRPAVMVASGAASGILSSVETMIEALGFPLLNAVTKPLSHEHVVQAFGRFRINLRHTAHGQDSGLLSAEDLVAALEDGRVKPHYQPKLRLADGEVDGFEALARLVDVDGALMLPARFIETAEQGGLIERLTLSMLDCILADLVAWNMRGFYPRVSLNVSARSLSERDFPNAVMQRVEAARVSPSAIIIEVTETALVSDLAAALGTLGRLRLKGFGLAIDDYGTGFSSMQQLSRLPFTEIKIDRAFVHKAHERWNLRTILQSAIEMGHRLQLTTVAEGIETPDELALLRELGCQYAQGYLLARPMPVEAVEPWLEQSRARIASLCGVQS